MGMVLAMMLILVVNNYSTLSPVEKEFDNYVNLAVERNKLLIKMKTSIGYGGSIHLFKNYVLRGQDKFVGRFVKTYEEIGQSIAAYRNIGDLTAEEGEALNKIEGVINKYRAALDVATKMFGEGHSAEEIDSKIKISDSPAIEGFTLLNNHFESMTDTLQQNLGEQIDGAMAQQLMILAIVGLLVLAAVFYVERSITLRLNATVKAMEDVAQGEGDLTQRLEAEGEDEIAALGRAFNSFAERIAVMVRGLSETTQRLGECTSQISSVSEQTRSAVMLQQNELDQVVTAVDEMSATAQNMANSAVHAAETTKQAEGDSSGGKRVVEQTVTSINALAGEVDKAAEVIHRLKSDSDGIGSVLDVIRGIAEQTNLLALNAAIEAARAGEQGRGFAVVADEVRTLASRTQASTQEIQEMIERLQEGTKEAVKAMDEGRKRAEVSVTQSADAGVSLEKIATAVGEINDMNNQIATAAGEQSTVTEEIQRNISNIRSGSEDASNGANHLASSNAELAGLTGDLQNMVGQFRV